MGRSRWKLPLGVSQRKSSTVWTLGGQVEYRLHLYSTWINCTFLIFKKWLVFLGGGGRVGIPKCTRLTDFGTELCLVHSVYFIQSRPHFPIAWEIWTRLLQNVQVGCDGWLWHCSVASFVTGKGWLGACFLINTAQLVPHQFIVWLLNVNVLHPIVLNRIRDVYSFGYMHLVLLH
jgi:hypothetical protein